MTSSKRNNRNKNSSDYEIFRLLRINKRLNQKLKYQQSILTLNEQSDDVKQYVQLREQYKKLINDYSLDLLLSPNNYIIEQIKRFRFEKEDLKIKYETLRDEFDSLIEQHSLLKTENEELTTKYKDLQFYFNLLKNNQKEIK